MFLSKKIIFIISILIVGGLFLYFFLPEIGYALFFKKPTLEILDIKGEEIQNGYVIFDVKVKIKNNAELSVYLKEVFASIYYKNSEIGIGKYTKKIFLESNKETILNVLIEVNTDNQVFSNLLQDLIKNESVKIKYEANALVEASFFGLSFEKIIKLSDTINLNLKDFIQVIGWNIQVSKIEILGAENKVLHLLAEVNATNLSSLDIIVKNATIDIYYKDSKIGTGVLNEEIKVKEKETKKIFVDIFIPESDILKEAINELVKNKSLKFDYIANLVVFSEKYKVQTTYEIKGSEFYELGDVTKGISIGKIIINKDEAYVIAYFENKAGINFELFSLKGNLIYEGKEIGTLDYVGKPIEIKTETVNEIKVKIKVNKENLGLTIKDLIENEKIEILTYLDASINIFDIPININIELKKEIFFEFKVNAELLSIEYLSKKEILAKTNVSISIAENFKVNYDILNAIFDIYFENEKIGKGFLDQKIIFQENQFSIALVKIIISSNLTKIIENFVNKNPSYFTLKSVYFKIQVLNETVEIQIKKDINLKINPLIFDINISNININKIEVIHPGNAFLVNVETTIRITNIYNLPIQINSLTIDIYEKNIGKIGEVNFYLPFSLLTNKTINEKFKVELFKEKIEEIANKLLVEGYLDISLKNITVNAFILSSNVKINIYQEFETKVFSPIKINIEVSLEEILKGNLPKSLNIKTNVRINITQTEIINFYIIEVNGSSYFKDKLIGSFNLKLNQFVSLNYFKFNKYVLIMIDENNVNLIVKQILEEDFIDIVIKNVIVLIKFYNYQFKILIPEEFNLKINISEDISVKILDFTVKPPGNIIHAKAEVYSELFNFQFEIEELSLKLYNANDTYFGDVRFVSLYTISSTLFKSILEIELTKEGLEELAKSIMLKESFSLFAKEIKIKGMLNDLNIDVTTNKNKAFVLRISTEFEFNYKFRINEIDALPPGNIFPIYSTITYSIKNGLHAPIKILNATLNIFNKTEHYLGKGILKNQVDITSDSGTIDAVFHFKINKNAAPWFAKKVVSEGKITFVLKNIFAKVKIYEYIIEIPIKGLEYTYSTKPIKIDVIAIDVIAIDFPSTVYVEVDVRINNPFKFGVLITNIKGSSYTVTFDIYESRIEAHPGTYLGYGNHDQDVYIPGKSTKTVYNIDAVIEDFWHLFSSPHGSLVPLQTQIYVDILNGKAGMKIYELYFTFGFEKYEIFIKYP